MAMLEVELVMSHESHVKHVLSSSIFQQRNSITKSTKKLIAITLARELDVNYSMNDFSTSDLSSQAALDTCYRKGGVAWKDPHPQPQPWVCAYSIMEHSSQTVLLRLVWRLGHFTSRQFRFDIRNLI